MNLLQQLANIPGNGLLSKTIKYGANEGDLNAVVYFIYTQGLGNPKTMREVVGNELYEACIDHHCQHIEISKL